MDAIYTVQVLVLLTSTAMATLLALHAWQRRPAVGSIPFALLMLAVTLWSLSYLLEITSLTLASKLFWVNARFLGVVIIPVTWLIFVWEYTGHEILLTRQRITAVSIIPILTMILVFTNGAHHLVWYEVSINTQFPQTHLELSYGAWFWIYTAFSYTYLLIGSIVLINHWRQQHPPLYRWQTIALLISIFLPWLGNILHVVGVSSLDLMPFAFAITGLMLVRYALRFRLFDINPIAYRSVINSMQDGVLVLDRKYCVVSINPAAQTIMQIETNPVGSHLSALWPTLERVMNGTVEKSLELAAPHNEDCIYEITVSPLYDWRQALQGRLLIVRDITERKVNEQLRDDLTRTMVHDLRAPISNTLFALQMLKGDLDKVVSPDNSMLLELTFANTEKTLHLVNQILDVHRLENGKVPVAFEQFVLADMAKRVFAAQQSRMAEKQLRVMLELPDDLPLVWADAGLIERVLQNLVDNAIKFSPAGGRITLSAVAAKEEHPGSNQKLWVTVRDEGKGIPASLQKTIFEKYVTGDQGETGTGLGLSFCQMALDAHGESIWVEPAAEAGATFVFSLATVQETELER
ncbi:MAG: PAS domain-containing protein [Anaerolineales bacterium]|nr:PAS domain-containing protein [Anaerolineales bacterium]